MKKGLINEAFRLQQLAGIAPVNEIESDSIPDSKEKEEMEQGVQPSKELRKIVLKLIKPDYHDSFPNTYEAFVKFLHAYTKGVVRGIKQDVYPKIIKQLVKDKGIQDYQDLLKKYHTGDLDSLGDMAFKQPGTAVSILKDLDNL